MASCRPLERRADYHVFDGEVVDASGHEMKHGELVERDVGNEQAVAAVDDDEMWAAHKPRGRAWSSRRSAAARSDHSHQCWPLPSTCRGR